MKSWRGWMSIVVFGLMGLLAGGAALANDGGIQYGGSPGLLKGHSSVVMQSEVINMTVGEKKITVVCNFVFKNDGPACAVRMGFPDEGEGALDPDEESDPKNVLQTPPKTTFDSFVSYVDSKKVQTKLIRADKAGKYWHTKTVTFPAHSIVKIRDVYTQGVSSQIAVKGSHDSAGYVLHTGSSWHGPIGRSEINVIFKRDKMTGPLKPLAFKGDVNEKDWTQVKPNQVYYVGPARPTVKGATLHFVRTKWRPTERDDIFLYFPTQNGF